MGGHKQIDNLYRILLTFSNILKTRKENITELCKIIQTFSEFWKLHENKCAELDNATNKTILARLRFDTAENKLPGLEFETMLSNCMKL